MNRNIRMATHQHCRCYYRQRAIVRTIFWTAITLAAVYAFHRFCDSATAAQICTTIGDCRPTR